jgi:hypothetical protein
MQRGILFMIQRTTYKLGQIALAALCLTIALTGCGPTNSGPAQSPTQAPAGVQPTQAPATPAAPPAQPPISAPTNAPASPAQPATPAALPTPAAVTGDEVAAIQTVLDYYDAINQQAYDRAYRLWAQNGAASGQTLDQFKQGFDGTVRASVQIGKTSAQAGAVSVPIAIASVVNVSAQEQQLRRFNGAYTVQLGANGWQLAGAKIAEVSGNTQPPADVGDPLAVLQAYYAAINVRTFGQAYTYWSNNGAASQQTFAEFYQGFAATDRVAIETGKPQIQGAAGSSYADTPIVIMATQTDGSQQTFCGTYMLRQLHVPPFDQLGWRIDRANIAPVANAQAGSDAAKRLLTNGCKP